MGRVIKIDPITRLEGHGRIDIHLDDEGRVRNCFLVIPELRGFEKFVEGRPVEELPRITSRICGVCPEAHHTASAKTVEAVYGMQIPPTAEIIRRLQYNAFVAGDHATHFYALAGPDFIVGPNASPQERNLIGVINKVGKDAASKLIRMRKEAHEVAQMLGGRPIHPVGMVPGGQAKAVTRDMRIRLIEIGKFMVEFAQFTERLFSKIVLSNPAYISLLRSESYRQETYDIALVNDNLEPDHYNGKLRVTDPQGNEVLFFTGTDYREHLAEEVVSWSYLKFLYLKAIGWGGLLDGIDSGIYRVAPLGMLNASKHMQTPLAEEQRQKMFAMLGGQPVHATLAFHWARIIEMLQCAELVLAYAQDERLCDPNVRVLPQQTPHEGIGVVEAPRGVLIHHYVTNDKGLVEKANLLVGTAHNYGSIALAVKKAAQAALGPGLEITEGMLNGIEMAFRAYDPCLGCATHALPGAMPLEIRLYNIQGDLINAVRRLGNGDGSLEKL
ncbi:MAG: Ni/Fe hydrogenase subunit alpha [Deltaproteobacteria bacterium]|nr:Ni/Fe hydrogenase subunit alpha [Deltaproteobacteria bacterium]